MSIEDSIARIQEYADKIEGLSFRSTNSFSHVMLLPIDDFEQVCLREAEAHEISLFRPTQPSSSKNAGQKMRQSIATAGNIRNLSKAFGPQRRDAPPPNSPLKGQNMTEEINANRYIVAADKLLQV